MADAVHTTGPSRVMRRAWQIFRETYHYPAVPFRSIGRPCFNSCLRQAWAEYRKARALSETATDTLERAAENYRRRIADLSYRGWGTNVERERSTIQTALAPINAELARRQPIALAIAA